tara:strand:+ start:143 stop:694 length:552 start_codon:yes stop_codon:yes gene_type:complete
MEDHVMLDKAISFAKRAHANQIRKYTGEAYFSHCLAVSDMIEEHLDENPHYTDPHGPSPVNVTVAMAVALLHDVVEDTPFDHMDIRKRFSDEVAKGVWFLTNTELFVGNRALRKELDRDRLAKAPGWIKLIKKFDIEHNRESIKKHDPKFYKIFKQETDELLEAMGMHDDEYYNGPADIQLAF